MPMSPAEGVDKSSTCHYVDAMKRDLGLRVRELRAAKGLSLRALASKAKVDYSYLSKIESGLWDDRTIASNLSRDFTRALLTLSENDRGVPVQPQELTRSRQRLGEILRDVVAPALSSDEPEAIPVVGTLPRELVGELMQAQ